MKRRCDCDSSILGSVVGPLPTLLFPSHPHGFSLSFIYYICFSIFVLFIFIHSPLLQPTYNPASPSLLFYRDINLMGKYKLFLIASYICLILLQGTESSS